VSNNEPPPEPPKMTIPSNNISYGYPPNMAYNMMHPMPPHNQPIQPMWHPQQHPPPPGTNHRPPHHPPYHH
jgi:hypothetical protein